MQQNDSLVPYPRKKGTFMIESAKRSSTICLRSLGLCNHKLTSTARLSD